ncbi:MAG: ribosome silencing factor [Candidatus Bipolaricaulota bacterium]|nr:ribosome silencing factor [Candidatus Bipolaricaulota bacterium]
MNSENHVLDTIIDLIEERKGTRTVVIDLRDAPIPTEYFVIAEGENPVHVKAIISALRLNLPHKPLHREGVSEQRWVVLDYGDIVVHVFTKEARDFYDIESLWADHIMKRPG